MSDNDDDNKIIIEDLTIENNKKNDDSFNERMNSLFNDLNFQINQVKELYYLEYKKSIKISKQFNIYCRDNINLIVKDFNKKDSIEKITKGFFNIPNYRENKNNTHRRANSSLNISNNMNIELKAQKKKKKFQITKFDLNIKRELLKSEGNIPIINLKNNYNNYVSIENPINFNNNINLNNNNNFMNNQIIKCNSIGNNNFQDNNYNLNNFCNMGSNNNQLNINKFNENNRYNNYMNNQMNNNNCNISSNLMNNNNCNNILMYNQMNNFPNNINNVSQQININNNMMNQMNNNVMNNQMNNISYNGNILNNQINNNINDIFSQNQQQNWLNNNIMMNNQINNKIFGFQNNYMDIPNCNSFTFNNNYSFNNDDNDKNNDIIIINKNKNSYKNNNLEKKIENQNNNNPKNIINYYARDNLFSNKERTKRKTIYDFIQNNFDFENCDEDDEEENEVKSKPRIKPVFKNVQKDKDGNKTIEEEPMDITKYNCKPFSRILNNCKQRTYNWELFPQEIAANQLEQSGGTCYMVSALESLSHIPKLLNYLFDSNFTSNKATFQTNFRQDDGTIEHYIIKNMFPTENNNNLKFMKPLEKEAYAIIFEKVWAVIRGGYEQIDGGKGFEVLNKVLGTFSKDLINKKMGKFEIK